jgi:hypothetical protein
MSGVYLQDLTPFFWYSQHAMAKTYRIDRGKLFSLHPFAREILSRLMDAGHEAVLIGGVKKFVHFRRSTWRGSG